MKKNFLSALLTLAIGCSMTTGVFAEEGDNATDVQTKISTTLAKVSSNGSNGTWYAGKEKINDGDLSTSFWSRNSDPGTPAFVLNLGGEYNVSEIVIYSDYANKDIHEKRTRLYFYGYDGEFDTTGNIMREDLDAEDVIGLGAETEATYTEEKIALSTGEKVFTKIVLPVNRSLKYVGLASMNPAQQIRVAEIEIYGTPVDAAASKLEAPTNTAWNGKTLSWDAVDGAAGYGIGIYKNGIFMKHVEANTNSCDLSSVIREGGEYTAKVCALGTDSSADSLDSDMSAVYKYNAPVNVASADNGGKVTGTNFYGSNPVGLINDGFYDLTTTSNWRNDTTATFEFDKEYTISDIIVYESRKNADSNNIAVSYSSDGKDFTDLRTMNTWRGDSEDMVLGMNVNVKAKYVKFVNPEGRDLRAYEIEIFGAEVAEITAPGDDPNDNITVNSLSGSVAEGKISAACTLKNSEDTAKTVKIAVAQYIDNAFVKVSLYDVTIPAKSGDVNGSVSFEKTDIPTADGANKAKVFLLESAENIRPLCNSVENIAW